MVLLEMSGGLQRQMDNVIALKNSKDPVALFETKWLKDARHHNDKGAWILQLREVRKKHATIRGAAAVLAGFWSSGVGVMLLNEGGIQMVWVATDEEVYSTLQGPLNEFLGEDSFVLDPVQMRKKYERPEDLLRFIEYLQETKQLDAIAKTWLEFEREQNLKGEDLVKQAIDGLLAPLPEEPQIQRFEIALQINTGNTIYREFSDIEDAREFLEAYFQNPQAILEQITPKPSSQLRPPHSKNES